MGQPEYDAAGVNDGPAVLKHNGIGAGPVTEASPLLDHRDRRRSGGIGFMATPKSGNLSNRDEFWSSVPFSDVRRERVLCDTKEGKDKGPEPTKVVGRRR